MYVLAYAVVIAYFLLAAISPKATVIPNTWLEFARVGVLIGLALLTYWWGAVTNNVIVVLRKRNPSDEGFDDGHGDVA